MSGRGATDPGHVFISYVHEDEAQVKRLTSELTSAGIEVWRDKDRLVLGEHWEMSVRKAIEDGAFFIACFSERSASRGKSYMNEELSVAIDELRKRPRDSNWFISVLLNPNSLPDVPIDASRTLESLYYLKLYEDWEDGIGRLISDLTLDGKRSRQAGATERSDLKRPVSAAYLTWRKPFEDAVDATLATGGRLSPGEVISRSLETGSIVPAVSLYETPEGAVNWIRWCQDPLNRDYLEAVRFWDGARGRDVARSIIEELGREDFDYVSFGPGTGQKDGALLGHWLEAGAEITYYPFDASMPLLTRAIRCVLDEIPEAARDRLYMKAVLADFNHAETVDMVFRQRSSPNVVAVLGNSLACQDDELALLRQIGDRMTPDDLLVLEVPLWSDRNVRALFESSAGLTFYFGPLASLGVPFESAKMNVSTVRDLSAIPGTVSSVVSYAEVKLGGRLYRDIPLAVAHRYTESDLLDALETIGFEVFASRGGNPSGEPLVCVARRGQDLSGGEGSQSRIRH